MFGMYRKLANEFTGVLTGKAPPYGGSLIRPEATGYGLIFFTQEMLKTKNESMQGKRVLISGSGNVATYAAEKAIALGAKVLTLSDSSGFIYDVDGIDEKELAWVKELKSVRRGRIKEYAQEFGYEYHARTADEEFNPIWTTPADIALPCATQNELNAVDAANLVANGVIAVGEGANMPCTPGAVDEFSRSGVLFAPGKASNAGGVTTSGLEMAQNSARLYWGRAKVEKKLREIMVRIHRSTYSTAKKYGKPGDYVFGANVAGFIKVADAMLAQGVHG
jgi:glutamate dehydrogenase (NADP+)